MKQESLDKIQETAQNPLSTPEKRNPENAGPQSAESHTLRESIKSDAEPSEAQRAHSTSQKTTVLRRLKQTLEEPRVWLEIAALAVLICYTYYARQQWKTMHDTFEEVKKQTEAAIRTANIADQSLKQARETFRQEDRPYVWLTNDLGQPAFVQQFGQVVWTWHVTNYGKSPAYQMRIYQYMQIGDGPPTPQFKPHAGPGPDLGAPLPPSKDDFDTVVSPPCITLEEFNHFAQLDRGIGISVRIEYTDAYNEKYETGFCLARLSSGAIGYCRDRNYIR